MRELLLLPPLPRRHRQEGRDGGCSMLPLPTIVTVSKLLPCCRRAPLLYLLLLLGLKRRKTSLRRHIVNVAHVLEAHRSNDHVPNPSLRLGWLGMGRVQSNWVLFLGTDSLSHVWAGGFRPPTENYPANDSGNRTLKDTCEWLNEARKWMLSRLREFCA
ncbi:hypothetical protein PIB30_029892 [Stylosanthes scabra]|uniref:Uncharacterized protein n=1 Tax=Stylosanthes scabra TaxID=79078 RepID=A0ABU6RBQ3_9FABA|nr:hypothetical protein [Stylosanthes scabra]